MHGAWQSKECQTQSEPLFKDETGYGPIEAIHWATIASMSAESQRDIRARRQAHYTKISRVTQGRWCQAIRNQVKQSTPMDNMITHRPLLKPKGCDPNRNIRVAFTMDLDALTPTKLLDSKATLKGKWIFEYLFWEMNKNYAPPSISLLLRKIGQWTR